MFTVFYENQNFYKKLYTKDNNCSHKKTVAQDKAATTVRLLPFTAKSTATTRPADAAIMFPVAYKAAGKVIADKTV